jgi:hypothetical protein
MSSNGSVSRKLASGKPGTKKMVEQYGDSLICVRYRYDAEKKTRYKTVEIIIDKGFWDPEAGALKENKKVEIKVGYNETELRARVKAEGGTWNREKRVWELGFKKVKKLSLLNRIIG